MFYFQFKKSWSLPIIGSAFAILLSMGFAGLFPNDVRVEPNLWFGADIKRVILHITDPSFSHHRTSVHPLFPLLLLPVGRTLFEIFRFLGFNPDLAKGLSAQLITSFSAGVTWLFVYMISTRIGLSRLKAFSVAFLYLSSAAFMFWWSTPETFSIGALTILLPFLLLSYEINSTKAWLFALIMAISITITNFIAGVVAAYAYFSKSIKLLRLFTLAIFSALILSMVQKSYMPTSRILFVLGNNESQYIKRDVRPLEMFYNFTAIPVIAPSFPGLVREKEIFGSKLGVKEETQLHFGSQVSNTVSGLRCVAIILWLAFFLNGLYKSFISRRNETCIALTVFLMFEFILHSFYGDSPFLYSAHFVPVMVIICGYSLVHVDNELEWLARLKFPLFALMIFLAFFLNLDSLFNSFDVGREYLLNA